MTPRGTDWGLALLVALGLVSGLATWFAGSPGGAWVFDAHTLAGVALAHARVQAKPRAGAMSSIGAGSSPRRARPAARHALASTLWSSLTAAGRGDRRLTSS